MTAPTLTEAISALLGDIEGHYLAAWNRETPKYMKMRRHYKTKILEIIRLSKEK